MHVAFPALLKGGASATFKQSFVFSLRSTVKAQNLTEQVDIFMPGDLKNNIMKGNSIAHLDYCDLLLYERLLGT